MKKELLNYSQLRSHERKLRYTRNIRTGRFTASARYFDSNKFITLCDGGLFSCGNLIRIEREQVQGNQTRKRFIEPMKIRPTCQTSARLSIHRFGACIISNVTSRPRCGPTKKRGQLHGSPQIYTRDLQIRM